jgi:hypothetical protein
MENPAVSRVPSLTGKEHSREAERTFPVIYHDSNKKAYEPLSGPFDKTPTPDGIHPSPAVLDLVSGQVKALLQSSPSYYQLDEERREEMERDLSKIAAYSAALVQEDWALSKQLGQKPVLVQRTSVPSTAAEVSRPRSREPLARAAAGPQRKEPEKPPEEFSPRAAKNVAKVTRDTLNAIAFPTFVADLIKGTYFAIVQATIQQMEAFGKLLANVAQTVDEFMTSNISENQARDFLVSSYPSHFKIEAGEDGARVKVRPNAPDSKPDFKAAFGLDEDVDADDDAAEEKLVPAARRKLAQNRHSMLAAMVMMGIQRIVVTSGHINAKMGFRINAHDTGSASTASQFDEQNDIHAAYGGGLFGSIFGGPEGSVDNSITYVSSTKKDSSDELDVSADLTGEVDIKFKSDYMPLEKFAKPAMIGLIQGNTPNPAANTPSKGGGMDTKEPKGTPATAPAPAAAP